jgi:hypothetical protein
MTVVPSTPSLAVLAENKYPPCTVGAKKTPATGNTTTDKDGSSNTYITMAHHSPLLR